MQRIPTGSHKSLQWTLRCCIDISHVLLLLLTYSMEQSPS